MVLIAEVIPKSAGGIASYVSSHRPAVSEELSPTSVKFSSSTTEVSNQPGTESNSDRLSIANMVVRIRLARFGKAHEPFYNIIIAQARYASSPRIFIPQDIQKKRQG